MAKKKVLVIGDLHCPFDLKEYLAFCKDLQKKYKTNETVFIGDVIDNHYSSYHETDPDGLSGGAELRAAINHVAKWHKAFPKATVIVGNHDRMIMRKAFSSAIPKEWIKDYNDVLGTKGWNWVDRHVIDGVQYIHGEGGTARTRCKADLMSTVQGHLHTQAYTEWVVGANFKVFGCQVGTGIDFDQYAFGYAKRGKKPAVGAAIVDSGNSCTNYLMDL